MPRGRPKKIIDMVEVPAQPFVTEVVSPPIPTRNAHSPEYKTFIQSYITDLAVARFTPVQIEERLRQEKHYVSLLRVNRILELLKDQWQARTQDNVEAIVTREVLALDALQSKLWPLAIEGEYKAVDRILALMDHRAKLLGLYAPTRTVVNKNVTLFKVYSDLDVEQV